jgi:ketosteroid isomerase-like protein
MILNDKLAAEETDIRELITNWAASVRAKDFQGILAHHDHNFLMFDVPPPLESRGLKAYQKTWDLFYSAQPEPVAFDIKRLEIIAGTDVAFAVALMQCAEIDKNGQRIPLDFRLTVGLRKINGRWVIVHEHHSVPAT